MGQNRWVRHVSAVIFKTEDGFEVQCYVHLFNSCTQNWFSIASIIEHVLSMVKNQNPKIINCVLEKWQCWLQSQQSTSPSLTWYWYENWHLCTTVWLLRSPVKEGHMRQKNVSNERTHKKICEWKEWCSVCRGYEEGVRISWRRKGLQIYCCRGRHAIKGYTEETAKSIEGISHLNNFSYEEPLAYGAG